MIWANATITRIMAMSLSSASGSWSWPGVDYTVLILLPWVRIDISVTFNVGRGT